jgi:hypothetical protein
MLERNRLCIVDIRAMNPVTLAFVVIIVGLIGFGIWKDQQDREGIPADLLRAAKGDKKLAKRLIANAKLRYPDKSDRWYHEKILYDLERDGAGSSGRKGRRSWGTRTNREKIENLVIIGMVFSLFNAAFRMISGMFGGGDRWN